MHIGDLFIVAVIISNTGLLGMQSAWQHGIYESKSILLLSHYQLPCMIRK